LFMALYFIIVGEILGGMNMGTATTPSASAPITFHDLGHEPEKGEIRSQVLRLALPAMAEQVLMTLVNIVDMMMVGSLGAGAIAAVGLSNQPMFTAQALFSAVTVGNTALIARLMGARDIPGANHAARQSFTLAVLLSGLLAAGVYFAAPLIIAFMGAEPAVAPNAIMYTRIVGTSLLFSLITESAVKPLASAMGI